MLGEAVGDGAAPADGLELAHGDGCWVGPGVGDPPGVPGWPGLYWPGLYWPEEPDGPPPAVPGAELAGQCRYGEPEG